MRAPKRVLVVAAHPDDEVLGCGGSIARHTSQGDLVSVLILAEGATSRGRHRDREGAKRELSDLALAAQTANDCLGVQRMQLLGFPDNRMDGMDLLEVVKAIELEIENWKPDTVYSHHAGDVNIDHRILNDAVVAACRPQPGHCVRTLLFFEIMSSTEWRPAASRSAFTPDWFINIETHWPAKEAALAAYASEMRCFPHPRSIEAVAHLAAWRGASIGCAKAEAFMLGRHVED